MNVVFLHNRTYPSISVVKSPNPTGGETIALQKLEPWFVATLTVGDFFTKSVGKARCSLDDNYNKKTGRELAQQRMKPEVFTVANVVDEGNGVALVVLKDTKENIYVLKKNGERVYFVEYN